MNISPSGHVMMITHPRSSERDKDIFALVKGDFVKVGSIEFSVSGRRRRLDVGLDARLFGDATVQSNYQRGVLCVSRGILLTMQQGFQGLEHRCKEWVQGSQQGTT